MRAVKGSLATPLRKGIEVWKGLARRPQSKPPHTLAWLGDELGVSKRLAHPFLVDGKLSVNVPPVLPLTLSMWVARSDIK